MNKYQEAYSIINGYVLFHGLAEDGERYKELIKALGMLNELVDKATPKKPRKEAFITGKSVYVYLCPTCHFCLLGDKEYVSPTLRYCKCCGQALKWEEEE